MTNLKKIFIGATAALTLGLAVTATSNEAEARWRRPHWGGPVAIGLVGGLALGAAMSHGYGGHYGGGYCYSVRRSVWSDYHGGYVVRRVRVCE